MWAVPALLFRQQVPRLAVGAESRSDDFYKNLTRVCHERNAAIVTALGPVPFPVQNLYHGISPSLQYFPLVPHPLDHPVKIPEHGRVVVYPEFEEFNRGFVWSHCLRICHRSQRPNQIVFCRFDPEGVCDRPLGELLDDVESELIGFRVEKGPEEPRPPSEDKPLVSQRYALFITDCLGCSTLDAGLSFGRRGLVYI